MQAILSCSPAPYLRWSESQHVNIYCVQKPRCVPHQWQHNISTGPETGGSFYPGEPWVSWCPPSRSLGLQQPQRCPRLGELRKVSYSPVLPGWDTTVTCGMASPRVPGRFSVLGCLIEAFPICSGRIACRSYASAREKPAVAMTEYVFIFIHLNTANHYNLRNL